MKYFPNKDLYRRHYCDYVCLPARPPHRDKTDFLNPFSVLDLIRYGGGGYGGDYQDYCKIMYYEK